MTTTTERPTWARVNLTNELSHLLDSYRDERDRAERMLRPRVAAGLDAACSQLDAVRTRLVQDGDEFVTEATAFIDAGRTHLAKTTLKLDRMGRGHITPDCYDQSHRECEACDCTCHMGGAIRW